MRQIVGLALMFLLISSAVGLSTRTATAAPAPTPAQLMPADVTFYAEFNTANLTTTIDSFFKLLNVANLPVTGDQFYGQLDHALTAFLGRPATFKGDVLNWLGGRAAIGVEIPDAVLQSPATNAHLPLLAIVAVKDETAVDAMLGDLFAAFGKRGIAFPQTTDQFGANPVTLYSNSTLKISVMRIPGELAFGTSDAISAMLDTLKNGKPSLAADARFQRTMALLTPTSPLIAYVGERALQYSVATAQAAIVKRFPAPSLNLSGPDPTDTAASLAFLGTLYKAYDGTALAVRGDAHTLALDVATSVDLNTLKSVNGALGTVATDQSNATLSGKLASQIPGQTAVVFEASNLARDYRLIRATLAALDSSSGLSASQKESLDQTVAGLDQFEQALSDGLDLDINQDILNWLGGDFALYGIFDPNSDLALASNGSLPFDAALLVSATDADQTRAFVVKLNTELTQKLGLIAKGAGKDLYTLSVSPRLTLGYGVVDSTFVLTTGGALPAVAGAIGGVDLLSERSAWRNAIGQLPTNVTSLAYLNLTPFQPYITQLSAVHNPPVQGLGTLLSQTQSAVIYSVAPAPGQTVETFALVLK